MNIHIYIHIHICIYTYIHTYTHMHIYIYIHIYTYIHICTYIDIYIYTYIHTQYKLSMFSILKMNKDYVFLCFLSYTFLLVHRPKLGNFYGVLARSEPSGPEVQILGCGMALMAPPRKDSQIL